jgi:hypothetical protein
MRAIIKLQQEWAIWNVQGTGEVHIGFLWEDVMERDHMKDPKVYGG